MKKERAPIYGNMLFSTNFWYMGDQWLDYTEAFLLTFSCDFDFTFFPSDSHCCFLIFGCHQEITQKLTLEPPKIIYDELKTEIGEMTIVHNKLHVPYSLELRPL